MDARAPSVVAMTNLRRTTAAILMSLLTVAGTTTLASAPAAATKARVETVTFTGSNAYAECLQGRTNVSRWAGVTIRTGCYALKSARPGQPTAYAFQFTR